MSETPQGNPEDLEDNLTAQETPDASAPDTTSAPDTESAEPAAEFTAESTPDETPVTEPGEETSDESASDDELVVADDAATEDVVAASDESAAADEDVVTDAATEDVVADDDSDAAPDDDTADSDAAPDDDTADSDADDAAEDVNSAAVDLAEEFKAELRAKDGEWYVIHTYAGYENRVKQNLENRIVSFDMEEFILEMQVPMEEVVEIKNGQRKTVRRVRIPGYVLIRMDLTDESWGVVRHTPGVTGFVGNAYDPVPLELDEVFSMLAPVFEERLAQSADAQEAGKRAAGGAIEVEFELGESVMVKEGSFEGHPATVTEIMAESQKLVVLLSIFERDVPVELGFSQVGKI